MSAICCLLFAAPVSAHGYLVRAIPPDRAVLERPPARLQYWFSEGLEPRFSTITLRDASGQVLATGSVSENDGALLTMRVPPNLPDGAYIADLRMAFAGDGHVVAESRVFFVGAAGELAGTAASNQAVAFEVVWRVAVYASMLLLLGTFAVYNLALVPAWGSKEHRAGLLPPRVMGRLNWLVTIALAAALIGNVLALLQQSMAFFGIGAGEVIAQGLWQIVRIGSRFGDVWNARIVLLVLIAGLHSAGLYFRKSQPEALRAFWAANLWGAALLVGTFSIASHASGSLLSPWAAIIVDYLHTLAVGIWAGGLAAMVLILPTALAPYSGEARRLALLAVMKRFSRIAMVGVVVVVATGIFSASNWLYTPGDVVATPYGGALLIKLLLVGGLLLIGLGHFAALNPARFERWHGIIERMRVMGFVKTLRLEVLFALLALVMTSLLTATPVPEPEFLAAGRALPAPQETQTVGDLDVTLTLSPGGPGLNTYDVLLTRNGAALNGVEAHLQLANPALDRRGAWHDAESAGDGLYVAAGDEVDRAGQWWALVDILNDNATTRAAFEWDISADASLRDTREFTPIHALALLGVVGAIGFAMLPLWRRFNRAAQWNTNNISVAVSALVATVVLVTITTAGLNTIQAQYAESLSPLPQIVNPTLPDQASLERGRALYSEHCAAWAETDIERDFALLLERIPRIRDEELFAITQTGWQRLPACDDPLSDVERWDIVNYMRVMRHE